jgi:DtxR family Mn-dependent transcriptional regulator
MNNAQENYLKTILSIELAGDQPTVSALAGNLSVKPASVTEMIKKLSAMDLVDHKNYKGFRLSEKGKTVATHVLRRHRLWETFLYKIMDFPLSDVHNEAEKLEHLTSEQMEKRMDEMLGHPEFDPHGHPIPPDGQTWNYPSTVNNWSPLSQLKKGQSAIIRQVSDAQPTFLQYLEKMNLTLNTEIIIRNLLEFDGSMDIEFNNQSVFISKQMAQKITVELQTAQTVKRDNL